MILPGQPELSFTFEHSDSLIEYGRVTSIVDQSSLLLYKKAHCRSHSKL